MKQKSVKDLYLVKQLILECPPGIGRETKKAVELINGVLLEEGGSKAVLYPYNDLKEIIIQLWGECKSPEAIAEKLGLDEDVVLCIIEDQSNHEERNERS